MAGLEALCLARPPPGHTPSHHHHQAPLHQPRSPATPPLLPPLSASPPPLLSLQQYVQHPAPPPPPASTPPPRTVLPLFFCCFCGLQVNYSSMLMFTQISETAQESWWWLLLGGGTTQSISRMPWSALPPHDRCEPSDCWFCAPRPPDVVLKTKKHVGRTGMKNSTSQVIWIIKNKPFPTKSLNQDSFGWNYDLKNSLPKKSATDISSGVCFPIQKPIRNTCMCILYAFSIWFFTNNRSKWWCSNIDVSCQTSKNKKKQVAWLEMVEFLLELHLWT